MPCSPVRRRAAARLLGWAGALLAAAGCETVLPRPTPAEPVAETKSDVVPARGTEPGPPPATPPGKESTRRGPYVFYHDFSVDRADPLFAELEALPDEVCGELGLPQPTVSHHLGLLRMQNLISNRRNGKQVFYDLDGQVSATDDNMLEVRSDGFTIRVTGPGVALS